MALLQVAAVKGAPALTIGFNGATAVVTTSIRLKAKPLVRCMAQSCQGGPLRAGRHTSKRAYLMPV